MAAAEEEGEEGEEVEVWGGEGLLVRERESCCGLGGMSGREGREGVRVCVGALRRIKRKPEARAGQ